MTKRAKPGDVLELTAPDGVVYLQYLGKHPEYGDGVAVCPNKQRVPVEVNAEFFNESYVTFFPVGAAVAQGLASVVGHLPCAGLPKKVRRPGVRLANRIESWIIEDGSSEVVRQRLSESELALPIAAIWNYSFLLQRLTEGWRPEMEG
jgi:hypothetical protein